MKHCNDCMGGAPARQGFFADAVIWRGETRGAEVQGRIIPSEILPDPSPSGLTLKRLTVMDECAEQADARIEFDACGNARAVGRLNIPLEAEFADACGNTYLGRAQAVYDVSIDARGAEFGGCGNVALSCTARDMCVQAISCDSVNYTLRLDAYAYLTRRELICPGADLSEGGCGTCAGGASTCASGCTNPCAGTCAGICTNPCAGTCARPCASTCALPCVRVCPSRCGCAGACGVTPGALAAGAVCGCRPGAAVYGCQPSAAGCARCADDDDCRTVVAMPVHKRRCRRAQ